MTEEQAGLIEALKSLGLTATAEDVQAAIRELLPDRLGRNRPGGSGEESFPSIEGKEVSAFARPGEGRSKRISHKRQITK